jgi:hypothetical protein
MITEFFAEHLGQLKAYGASIDNPMEMDILFKGLLAVLCEDFCRYISNKKDMYDDESLTLTPKELVIMANQRYMLMKTEGTFSNAVTSMKEIIELRAELNQIRALTENIPQVTNDKSPDEVLAYTVRSSSRKLHTSSETWKQVPEVTTTAWVTTQKSCCRLSPEEPPTHNKSCCRLSSEEPSTCTSEPLSNSLPRSQTTRNPINLTEDATSATGTHAMLFGTASITHGAFIN